MPAYVVARIQLVLNDLGLPVKGSKILLLGLTYKPDVSDARETPAIPIIRRLRELGAVVDGHDPHLERFAVDGTCRSTWPTTSSSRRSPPTSSCFCRRTPRTTQQ